jgi:hypothetical protein
VEEGTIMSKKVQLGRRRHSTVEEGTVQSKKAQYSRRRHSTVEEGTVQSKKVRLSSNGREVHQQHEPPRECYD